MKFPYVSVVIPVLNTASHIEEVLRSLENQSYPNERYEVIIVDNGSTDNTKEKVNKFKVRLLEEKDIKSPYAARNKGINHATGEIVALTDGNKVPDKFWLERGVKCLNEEQQFDLVGGKVAFTLSEGQSLGEILDSITFLDNKKYIEQEKASLGGNLLFRKDVYAQIGEFPVHRSGMDIYWSRKAVNMGFTLKYCSDAVVYAKARSTKDMLLKSFRVGIGHPRTMKNAGNSNFQILCEALKSFIPPSPIRLYKRIKVRGESSYFIYFIPLWILDYGRKIAMAVGRLKGLPNLILRSR